MRVKCDKDYKSVFVVGLHRCHLVLFRLAECLDQHVDLEGVLAGQLVDLREDVVRLALQIYRGGVAVHASRDHIRLKNIHEPDFSLF